MMQILKQIVVVSIFIFLSKGVLFAQTAGVNYQALILNSEVIQIPGADVQENEIALSLEEVSFRFSITNGDFEDYYVEEQSTTTDENGMVSLIVGEGTPLFSTFYNILWDGTLKYLNIEIDIHSLNQGYVFLDLQKILYLPQSVMVGPESLAIEVNAGNGLYLGVNNTVKLGGVLTEPTEIISDTDNTLAINGLEEVEPTEQTKVLTQDPNTGIITRSPVSSLFQEQVTLMLAANDGQNQFSTPLPIADAQKINVYRNGVRIDFSVVNTTTIEVEVEAVCYQGDEIRIVQFN